MDRKGVALLFVAILLAVAAGGAVYYYLQSMPTAEASAPETVPVVVAAKDMTFGTTIEEQHVKVVEFPKEALPTGYFASVDTVLNQTTKVFLVENEPILASKLSAIGGGLSVRVPANMRAMSIKINDVTGVSGFVLPGDRVDVVVTIENVSGSNIAVTKTVLQDIEVLAAGVKTETRNNRNITVQTVTVLVDPGGAEKLALGVHQGKVHLSLRNPVDHERVDAKSTDTNKVLGISARKTTRRRSTLHKTVTTKKDPVAVEPTFTIIRDGKILKQESPTGDSGDKSGGK